MHEYLTVWRAKVDEGDAKPLLDVEPRAIAEAEREILFRVVTHLGSLEGRSKFSTWAYTVATRSLFRGTRGTNEAAVAGAEQFAALLDAGMGDIDSTADEAEYRLLCEEVRLSCTDGMLLCIPREQRAAYLLADAAGLTDVEGAEALGCSREAFRHRVSRARRTLKHVIDNRCGLIDPANPCRCGRQIAAAVHPREELRVWIEPYAKQLDEVSAIGGTCPMVLAPAERAIATQFRLDSHCRWRKSAESANATDLKAIAREIRGLLPSAF